MAKTIHNTKSFRLGTTYTIGSYILPGQLNQNINSANGATVKVTISNCIDVINRLNSKEIDLGIIETPTFHKDIIAQEWIDDEMVICSNIELEPFIEKNDFYKYRLICQNESSPINKLIHRFFKKIGISHRDFHAISTIDNTTASIQSVRWSRPNIEHPTITIVSSLAIEDEVKYKKLFMSRIKNYPLMRKFYIVYHKDVDIKSIENIIQELKNYYSL